MPKVTTPALLAWGATHLSEKELTQVAAARWEPKTQLRAAVASKFAPVTVISVPPVAGPKGGLTSEIVGPVRQRNVFLWFEKTIPFKANSRIPVNGDLHSIGHISIELLTTCAFIVAYFLSEPLSPTRRHVGLAWRWIEKLKLSPDTVTAIEPAPTDPTSGFIDLTTGVGSKV